MKKAKGRLWVVAAPSGGGKTSLVEAAIEKMDDIVRSVSFTTREKRIGEIDGRDYVFVDKAEFERLIVEKKMLEYETVFDHYYGTSLDFINRYLNDGEDVILTIDWQGSRHVRKIVPDSKGVFILPPQIGVLEERLRNRGQDNEAVIARRMTEAKEQMSHYKEFDYLIINDDFDVALNELMTILTADRLLRERREVREASIINKLLF
ncbi:MAG: guanylate kinase [Gammaproteobacteria bacterium]|nr:MAG: guanylate kinase [Gammaproteobacteria bacterium]